MPPAGVETTILIARVGQASAQAVSEAASVRHAIAAAQILADVRTSASPFPCVIGQPAAAATRCHMGREGGQEIKISFHRVKWLRPTCRRTRRRKLGAERLGKCGSDLLHRRYEAPHAVLQTDR